MRYLYAAAALIILGAGAGLGCGGPAPGRASGAAEPMSGSQAPPGAKAPPPSGPVDWARAKVDESGLVPILEYHNIRKGRTPYDRSPAQFRKDLEVLYREGYRPVSLRDYLDNRIDVPLGTSPIVLTFDDSSPTQFRYQADGTVDPDCAYGILKAFHDLRPDFPMRGVFYMNASPTGRPAPVFGDQATAAKKVNELLAVGMEVGNHTVTHPRLKRLSDAAVQKELADCAAAIHALAPQATVDTLALPFGMWPRNRKLAEAGESGGVQYRNRAVLLVGANPALAPGAPRWDPLRLPRVQAYSGEMGSDYWLAQLRRHPGMRYISDGDPGAVTVPKARAARIDPARTGAAKLRTY